MAGTATRVISAETDGANCFAAAIANGFAPTRLEAIRSVATSLGALQCSPTTMRLAQEVPTDACTVSDQEALDACAFSSTNTASSSSLHAARPSL